MIKPTWSIVEDHGFDMSCARLLAHPHVLDHRGFWTDAPPEPSPLFRWWWEKAAHTAEQIPPQDSAFRQEWLWPIELGHGYDDCAHSMGVWIWEYNLFDNAIRICYGKTTGPEWGASERWLKTHEFNMDWVRMI